MSDENNPIPNPQTSAEGQSASPLPADPAANQPTTPTSDAATPPPTAGTPSAPPTGGGVSPLMSDDELSEDQFVTGGDDHSFITGVPVPAHPNTKFNEKKFLELLAKSISLTKTEKQRIIASIPKLSQYQIDELIRIFEEEQKKFAELNSQHADQLQQLESKQKNDWEDIEMKAKQEEKKKDDDQAADALRKQLGLD